VFLDITATVEGRRAIFDVVRAVAAELTIPQRGAARRPDLREAAEEFGSQC
jgi:imidazole glycerol phosphate synthase subunit HisF